MIKTDQWSKLMAPIRTELASVDETIQAILDAESTLLSRPASNLLQAGGKRLRPAFLLLAGKLVGDDVNHLVPFAAAVEMAHAATLIHDDLIDASALRRGKVTVNAEYGYRMAVYTGNYLFNQALLTITRHAVGEYIGLLVRASIDICQGEIEQLQQAYQIPLSLRVYFQRIKKKTALLIALSCQLGGLMSQAAEEEVRALYHYGYCLGMAFQISDDVLDFIGAPEVTGKPAGSDVANGLITLPVLYALAHSRQSQRLAQMVTNPDLSREHTADIVRLVTRSGGIRYAQRAAERYTKRAVRSLQVFPDSPSKQMLVTAARQVSGRSY